MPSQCPALAHFLHAMEKLAPLKLADKSWDNVGLLFETPVARLASNGKCRVLLTIDLTEPVYQEAVEKQVGIIMSYHPPWFSGEKSLTLDRSRGVMRMVALCASSGISIYSPHSALDAIKDGINTHVAKILSGDMNVESINPIIPAADPIYFGTGARHA